MCLNTCHSMKKLNIQGSFTSTKVLEQSQLMEFKLENEDEDVKQLLTFC